MEFFRIKNVAITNGKKKSENGPVIHTKKSAKEKKAFKSFEGLVSL